MKVLNRLLVLPVVLLTLSCNADDNSVISGETAKMVIEHYISGQATVSSDDHPYFRVGDFNGDGAEDMAILFIPGRKPETSERVKVSMPWVYPGAKPSETYHKSLAIVNGTKGGWLSARARVFVLLDSSGALEGPSFELLVARKSDNDYKAHSAMLPVETSNDFLVLPTESGVDTYVYWSEGGYKLVEPEEVP